MCVFVLLSVCFLSKTAFAQGPYPGVSYQAHVQGIGWMNWVSNGATAGTVGQSKRLEAFRVKLVNAPSGYHVSYQAHVQYIGWQREVRDGATAGTEGQSLRIEAIRVRLWTDSSAEQLNLNITGYKQDQSLWCWAATSENIIKYITGNFYQQPTIVTAVKGRVVNEGAYDYEDLASLNKFGVTSTYVTGTIPFGTIKDNIRGWYSPIKVWIHWNNSSSNHDLVIHGYYQDPSSSLVAYMDPGQGSNTWNLMSYNSFCSNSSFTWVKTFHWNH